jgi:hypothetical protein
VLEEVIVEQARAPARGLEQAALRERRRGPRRLDIAITVAIAVTGRVAVAVAITVTRRVTIAVAAVVRAAACAGVAAAACATAARAVAVAAVAAVARSTSGAGVACSGAAVATASVACAARAIDASAAERLNVLFARLFLAGDRDERAEREQRPVTKLHGDGSLMQNDERLERSKNARARPPRRKVTGSAGSR